MKIGILGGSFNPIHNGHLRIAIEVLESLSLDRVELVPAPHPPHKSPEDLLTFPLRYEMVIKAIADVEGLLVSPIEANREGPSYTVDTLREYNEVYEGEELFFIIGGDELSSLDTWYRWKDIFELANVVVVGRGGEDHRYVDRFLERHFCISPQREQGVVVWPLEGKKVLYLAIPRLEISSSLIREKVRARHRIRGLVPFPIEEDIYKYYTGREKG